MIDTNYRVMHYYYSTVYFSWQSLGRLLIMSLLEVSERHPLFLLQLCNRRTQERPLQRPCQRGSHIARLNFETSCVGVYKMLVASCRLCRHWRNLAKGGCLWSQFHFTCCRYFLGHVACRNLPWQGLITS